MGVMSDQNAALVLAGRKTSITWRKQVSPRDVADQCAVTPEPKPISVGIVGAKGRLSPAAEKFWQCAKEAASRK